LQPRLHQRPAEERCRVDGDPYELNNLADDPICAETKTRFRSELERWLSRQGDPGAAMDDMAPYGEKKMQCKLMPPSK
jgi:hypothetical protein